MKFNIFTKLFPVSIFVLFTTYLFPKLVFADDGYTRFNIQLTSIICAPSPIDYSLHDVEVQAGGLVCDAECNGHKRYGRSRSDGMCVVSFPKNECDIGDPYYVDTCGCPGCHGGLSCMFAGERCEIEYRNQIILGINTRHVTSNNMTGFSKSTDVAGSISSVPEFGILTSSVASLVSLGGYLLLRFRR